MTFELAFTHLNSTIETLDQSVNISKVTIKVLE